MLYTLPVLAAVKFDNELSRETDKIDNIRTDRILALELEPRALTVPHVPPQSTLGIGLVAAQASGCVSRRVPVTPRPGPLPWQGRGERAASLLLFHG